MYNGVLIARLNTDVALTDFEIAVRDLVSNVENAYWDLYFGYRELDAKVQARDAALDTWRKIYALYEADRGGGEAEKEAQAREQFFRFQEDVQNALSGEPYESTRNWNGQPSGAFRTTGGVLVAERRLRLLDGPAAQRRQAAAPDRRAGARARSTSIGTRSTSEATTRRAELRRQKWQIRRRELELIASKNYLLPRLDAVGRYRWRGFGDDLFPIGDAPPPPDTTIRQRLREPDRRRLPGMAARLRAVVPIGFRQAHVARAQRRAAAGPRAGDPQGPAARSRSRSGRRDRRNGPRVRRLQTSYNRLGRQPRPARVGASRVRRRQRRSAARSVARSRSGGWSRPRPSTT